MNEGFNKIGNVISGMQKDTVSSISSGTVMSINPLSIKVNDRDTLPASFFVLSRSCREWIVEGDTDTADGHTHHFKVIVHNNLQEGDKVSLISLNGNQKYYVTDRAY